MEALCEVVVIKPYGLVLYLSLLSLMGTYKSLNSISMCNNLVNSNTSAEKSRTEMTTWLGTN